MTKFNNRAYQDKLINDSLQAWADGNKVIMAVLPTGGGKCLGRGTPVLMYDGRVLPVEQVVVGDLLMGPDSTPRVVQSLATGSEQLYKVTPVKGDPYVVNESHILSLRNVRGVVKNVPVRAYLRESKHWQMRNLGWRVPGVLQNNLAPELTRITVEPIGVGEYFGFEIDGDRLFMLGDFTVTHNTVCMSSIIKQHKGYGVAMVHRGELVSQISITLARSGIVHSVAGSRATITAITAQHYALFGRSYVNQQSADWIVASVDTVVSGKGVWVDRFKRSTLGIIDEGHHCLKDNKWGRCFSMLAPDSKGWLPTATPRRSDGKGLGSHSDGIADVLVEGPDMRALIDQGYLTDYTVRVIDTNDLDLSNVKTTASGELSKVGVAKAVAKSRVIVGNVVEKYLQFAKGKLGVTFAATIEEGERLTAEFNAQGVPAVMLTGDTPTAERAREIASFSRREKLMLVNVDLFGEGFDLPAIEIVIMARPTASFILYTQQFGRALRLLIDPELMRQWDTFTVEERLAHIAACDKPRAIIHDHVGNFIRHGGPPDMPQQWTLDPVKKGASAPSDAVPMTACAGCYMPFEKFFKVCPFCAVPVPPPTPSQRTQPETVDGDIFEVSAEELAKLRAGVVDVFALARIPHDLQNTPTAARLTRINAEKITNHRELMDTISLWAGRYIGEDNSVIARRFYHTFGVDVLTAAGMNARDADTLKTKIMERMT